MYLIDQTYFIKQYHIPNLNEMDSDVLSNLEQYIDKDARSVIKNALGYSLFKEFDTYVIDGVLDPLAPQKWKDLVNGKEYLRDGELVKWKGIAYSEGLYKSSFLVPYIYHNWLNDNISQVTGVGEKVVSAQNAINVNSNQRSVGAWNDFLSMYQGEILYKLPTSSIVRGIKFTDWTGTSFNDDIHLIGFLEDNEVDFPNASKAIYNSKNQLGI